MPPDFVGWWTRLYFPVPVSNVVCGLLLALSFMFSVAVRVPVADGVNVTLTVQVDFAGTLSEQVSVAAKSDGSASVKVVVKGKAISRLLCSVVLCAALVVPTCCAANVTAAGVRVTWAMPVPVSEEVRLL